MKVWRKLLLSNFGNGNYVSQDSDTLEAICYAIAYRASYLLTFKNAGISWIALCNLKCTALIFVVCKGNSTSLWFLRWNLFCALNYWRLWILFHYGGNHFLFRILLKACLFVLRSALVSWISFWVEARSRRLLWSGGRDHDRSVLLYLAWELQGVFLCVCWRTLFVARNCLLASGSARLVLSWAHCSRWSPWLSASFRSCRRNRSVRLWWIYFLDYDWLCPIFVPFGLFVLFTTLNLLCFVSGCGRLLLSDLGCFLLLGCLLFA